MNDYIDLINALRSCNAPADYCDSCPYHYGGIQCLDLNKNAADAIEALQAQIPQWISVDDRLPEQGQRVLICDSLGYMSVGSYSPDKYLGAFSFYVDGECEPDAKWWMPLPNPPKEDNDGD